MKSWILKIANLLPPTLLNRIKILPLIYDRAYLVFKLTGKVPNPVSAIIDPINVCHLRCPLCPTGTLTLGQKQQMMPFSFFLKVLNEIPSLKIISLFNWGEPFLNGDILKMIKGANEKGIFTIIHSNFNIKKDLSFFEEIVCSGLDRLSISLDGASQGSYEKYRIGGDLLLIKKNLETLNQVKKKMGAKNPQIIWQFIVNRHNEKEINQVKQEVKRLGIHLNLGKVGLGDTIPDWKPEGSLDERRKEWLPLDSRYRRHFYRGEYRFPLNQTYCHQLFKTPSISPDGRVYPCCLLTDEKNAFGDLNRHNFKEIWNNKIFSYSRSLFIKKQLKKEVTTICEKCINFAKRLIQAFFINIDMLVYHLQEIELPMGT